MSLPGLSVITIGIDPNIHLGPVTLAWHGITIALGIYIGYWLGARWLARRGHDPAPLQTLALMLAAAGVIGGRLFYVLEHGGSLLGTRGFTFDGGFILAAVVLVVYVRRTALNVVYLDAIAIWLPLGVAIGRIGDVINGEHYGAVSRSFLAVRNSHPDALTPNSALAYHNGGLYEVLLALFVFAAMLAASRFVSRPGDLSWLVIALFAIGRFGVFFLRSDSPELALGLSNAQWTSVGLLAVVVAGRTWAVRRGPPAAPPVSRAG